MKRLLVFPILAAFIFSFGIATLHSTPTASDLDPGPLGIALNQTIDTT